MLVVATLAVPRTAHNVTEARSLGFGYPVNFVSVDESVWKLPYPQTYSLNPRENVAHVNGEVFVLDWILVTCALWITLWLVRRWRS